MFDIALMNPPYDKNLHLKFLEKVMVVAEEVVSIQPGEWLVRPYIRDNWKKIKDKYKNIIGQRLSDLEMVDNREVKAFDAGIDTLLGIFTLTPNGGFDYDNYYKEYDKTYLNNINKFDTESTIKDILETYTNQKYFVPIRTDGNINRWWCLQLINYLDILVDGKVYSGDYKGLTVSEARAKNPRENPRNHDRTTNGVSFNTLKEAVNFRDSLKTEAYLYIIALLKTTRSNPLNKLPVLPSYTRRWTNDDIFDYFNIEHRDEIIKLMRPYMDVSKDFDLYKTKEELNKL